VTYTFEKKVNGLRLVFEYIDRTVNNFASKDQEERRRRTEELALDIVKAVVQGLITKNEDVKNILLEHAENSNIPEHIAAPFAFMTAYELGLESAWKIMIYPYEQFLYEKKILALVYDMLAAFDNVYQLRVKAIYREDSELKSALIEVGIHPANASAERLTQLWRTAFELAMQAYKRMKIESKDLLRRIVSEAWYPIKNQRELRGVVKRVLNIDVDS